MSVPKDTSPHWMQPRLDRWLRSQLLSMSMEPTSQRSGFDPAPESEFDQRIAW